MKALMDAHTHNDALFFFEWGTGSGGGGGDKGKRRWVGERGDCDDDGGVAEAMEMADGGCLHFDLEGRTGNMVVAPLDQQDVVATLAHQIVYLVLVAAGMLDEHLVAGALRSVNANE